MENNCVQDETKQTLEAMNESNEKVSVLHEDLKHSILGQQLEKNLRDLSILKNKNLVELEDNENLKGNFKASNQHFLRLAQQIYCCDQELCSDFNSYNRKMIKNAESLNQNIEAFQKNVGDFQQRNEAIFKKGLELKNEKHEEDKMRIESKAKKLTEENELSAKDINKIDQKIVQKEDFIKKEQLCMNSGKIYDKVVETLEGVNYTKENEINEFSQLLKEVNRFKDKLENDEIPNISELDYQIQDNSGFTVDDLQINIDEVCKKIKLLEENTKDKQNICSNRKNGLRNGKINLKMKENCKRNKPDCNTSLFGKESFFKQDLLQKTELGIPTTKDKIGDQQEHIEGISKFLEECKKDTYFKVELENKEEKRKEDQTGHQPSKKEYDTRILDLEAELKHGQEEIQIREETNRKLQRDTEKLIAELNKWKKGLRQMETEKLRQTKEVTELEEKKTALSFQIAQGKSKKPRKVADKVIPPNQARPATSVVDKKTRHRYRDSESSVEGETRVLSHLIIKDKMKVKKATKGTSWI